MIDTLNFKIPNPDRDHILQIFATKGKEGQVTYYPNDNKAVEATFKNYKFRLTNNNLTAYGSISKLYNTDNFRPLSFAGVQQAIMMLEDFLEMSLNDAQILRIDYACNVEVEKQVNQYIDLFTSPIGYKARIFESETTYFENNKETLLFYDKTKELISKPQKIDINYKSKNILRYELRIRRNISKALGWEDSKLENLHNYHYYMAILRRYYRSYKSLPIHTTPLASQLNWDDASSFKKSLIIEGIRSLGGRENVSNIIKGVKMKRETKYNIRKFLNQLPHGQILNPELKKELDNKILSVCMQEARQAFIWSDQTSINNMPSVV